MELDDVVLADNARCDACKTDLVLRKRGDLLNDSVLVRWAPTCQALGRNE